MKSQTLTGWMLVPPAFIGLIDSAYIAINSLQGFIVPCGWAGGCDQVLNSPYARVSGVSIAWAGLLFYAVVAGAGTFAIFGFSGQLRFTLMASILAFAFTLYLLYLQAVVLKAFCDYCLLSAFLVTLILAIHLFARPWDRARRKT
jgi:uncharacterized membrane protein